MINDKSATLSFNLEKFNKQALIEAFTENEKRYLITVEKIGEKIEYDLSQEQYDKFKAIACHLGETILRPGEKLNLFQIKKILDYCVYNKSMGDL